MYSLKMFIEKVNEKSLNQVSELMNYLSDINWNHPYLLMWYSTFL